MTLKASISRGLLRFETSPCSPQEKIKCLWAVSERFTRSKEEGETTEKKSINPYHKRKRSRECLLNKEDTHILNPSSL